MKNVQPGLDVAIKVRMFSDPQIAPGATCRVVKVYEERGVRKVVLRGPDGQIVQVRPGDVEARRS